MADTVLLAYVHPATEIQHSFHSSLMALAMYDAAHHRRIVTGHGPLQMRCGSGGLVHARNTVVRHWLDETSEPWLWTVDTDMGFAPDVIDRLVEAADPDERPVVGGLCFSLRQDGPDGMGGFHTRPVPTIYDWGTDPKGTVGFSPRRVYTQNALIQCAGTGSACLLIHRTVAEKLRAEHGDAWYDPVRYQDGRPVSEDLSFCYRLGMAGVPLFVHTGVRTTHAKQVWLGESDYLAWLQLNPEPTDA